MEAELVLSFPSFLSSIFPVDQNTRRISSHRTQNIAAWQRVFLSKKDLSQSQGFGGVAWLTVNSYGRNKYECCYQNNKQEKMMLFFTIHSSFKESRYFSLLTSGRQAWLGGKKLIPPILWKVFPFYRQSFYEPAPTSEVGSYSSQLFQNWQINNYLRHFVFLGICVARSRKRRYVFMNTLIISWFTK